MLASIHEMAHLIVAQGEATKRPRGSIVAVRSREEWGELIQDVAGIGAGAASELLWWYTFNPKVSEPSVPIQPLIEIQSGNLAVAMNLVTHSNVERNLQKLLNRHPNLRSFYENVKKREGKDCIGASQQPLPFRELCRQADRNHQGCHRCGSSCL